MALTRTVIRAHLSRGHIQSLSGGSPRPTAGMGEGRLPNAAVVLRSSPQRERSGVRERELCEQRRGSESLWAVRMSAAGCDAHTV